MKAVWADGPESRFRALLADVRNILRMGFLNYL